MNKEELLKAIEQKRQAIWPTDTGKMAPATVPNNLEQGWLNALKWMKDLINSLPDEQLCWNDMTEEEKSDFFFDLSHQKQIKQPSDDLEKEIKRKYKNNNALMMPIGDFRKLILHFTNWQKEQMMKGLCYETKVYRDEEGDGIDTPIESWLALENNEITNLPNIGLKDGDKVKVIIVKDEQ